MTRRLNQDLTLGTEPLSYDLVETVTQLVDYVNRTAADHATNARRGIEVQPVPFFGDVLTAEALTVGVNSSADEFRRDRWPVPLSPTDLTVRLRAYFCTPARSPHPWFDRWSEVLRPLGYAYDRNASHLDLSPRATVSMGAAPDRVGFQRMLESDTEWLFRVLRCCPRARVLFLAGTVSKTEYLFEFLQRVAPRFGYSVEQVAVAGTDTRRQASRELRLRGPDLNLPMFFVSNSPSSRRRTAMASAFAVSRDFLLARGFGASRDP